jgi:ABC-type spermidine/putrescine transport system permease subunit II
MPGILSAAIFAFTLSWDGGILHRFVDTPNSGAARHRYPFVAPAVRPAM